MDFGQAFSFPTQDPDWIKKIVIIALVGLIPFVGQIVLIGWLLEITRHVIRGEAYALPDLDFGGQLSLGFKGFVAALGYALPIIIFQIPFSLLPAFVDSSNSSSGMNTVIAIVSVCCGGLILLYSLVLAVTVPAAMANVAAEDRIGAGFQFGKIFGMLRAAPGAYLMVLLGTILTGFVASLGFIACGIGVLLTSAYAQAVNGHLYGQAYNQARHNAQY